MAPHKSIALVLPPSTFLTDPMVWPSLGVLYLSSQLEKMGHQTELIDLSVGEALPADGEYDQMWISSTSPQMFEVRKIAKITREWKKTRTVLGGAAPWADLTSATKLPFNLIVSGESDHPDTLRGILDMAERNTSPEAALFSPVISRDLSWVIPPNRRWTQNYHAYMPDRKGEQRRMTSLFTTRGCPMSCSFCESGRNGVIWDASVRYESVANVEAQIREIDELGFSGLAYYDDIFILNRKRTLELLELHRKYNKVFRCFLRSDILCKQGGREYLEQLANGGLIEVFVGVESGSNKIKESIHKGTTVEQDAAVLEWCKELGVTCKMSFILGLPGETQETMEETRTWILKNRPHIVQVDRLIPFPGTPLTRSPAEYDLTYESTPDEEWFFRGRHDMASKSFVSTSHLSREQIDTFWHNLEREVVLEGLSTYGH